MQSTGIPNSTVYLALTLTLVGLCLLLPAPAEPQISTEFNSQRYLTHIATDKPIYRTGEKLYVRGVLLRADDHAPGAAGTASVEIKGPRGETVFSGASSIVDSIVGFSWDIPANQAGGEYTVRIFHPQTGDAPAERKFDIRAYRAPRLKSQIVFVRDGYGPGDTVTASLHVDRAEGGIPAGAKVSVSARVDGEEVWKSGTLVDGLGNAGASFKLPAIIARGEGTLAMTIEDGGTVETATKTIPILLQTLDLAIYPEGGDLIAGLSNRIYVEGKTPSKKPADMAGVVVSKSGRQVATFRTEHEGRGRLSFVPVKGETYSLRITEPSGIKTTFPLPALKESGVVLTATSDVTPKLQDVAVRIAATADGRYGVALSQRGKELSFKSITLKANEPAEVAFTVPRLLDGVIVGTVYDDRKIPVAERLLFRQPEHNLNVHVTADRKDYVPGDKVTLRVATTDDTGKPVGAQVGLTITDSSVLEMIDKREQAPRLPVMVLLESDVKDLSDAHVYLDETNPKAPLATDLLLGTQGWRRFAVRDLAKFVGMHGDAARRILSVGVMSGTITGSVTDRSAALIPGVTVKATAVDTGAVSTVYTNESGVYSFRELFPGKYTVTASLPGFQTKNYTDIQLKQNTNYRYNFQLEVASANSAVEVSVAADKLLATQAASVGQVLALDKVQDLPIVGNDVLDLIAVMPGLEQADFKNVRADKVIVVRDGIQAEDLRQALNVINQDLVGEVRLILNPVDAERGMRKQELARGPLIVTREYAHALRSNWNEGDRSDFAETVYWNAGIKTESSTGIATVAFNLSDSVTSFRVLADGFSRDGVLGSSVSHIESVRPFFIEPKVPLEVTSGDVIQLPIGINNGTSRELQGTAVTPKAAAGITFTRPGEEVVTLRAKERTRRLIPIEVAHGFSGDADLTLDARAGSYRDTVSRKIHVQPLGFPYESSAGGVLEPNGSKSLTFTLPSELVPGSLSSSVMVYPTPLASMTQALQSLLREPAGCFEQTSSTSYPIVMAQQYFLTHAGVDPALIERTRGLLDSAYKRLLSFETRTQGYEWFGGSPGHEALTAYGLMQFTDMSKVRSVDTDMLGRTRAWLLSRRDGTGSFSRNAQALDSFGQAPADTTNAYITWALIESGQSGLEKEVAAVKASAKSTTDSYIIALAANILHAAGDQAGARELMDRLAKVQDSSGTVTGSLTSITRSGGYGLGVETTALSVLAWTQEPDYAANAEKGLKWIMQGSSNGMFGSTQSTILALRAIVAHDAANARPKAPGRIFLTIDGKAAGAPVAFSSDDQGAIVLPDLTRDLGPGKHTVVLRMEEGSKMPFSISVKHHSTLPDSAEQTRIGIQVALRDKQIQEGAVTEATVSIVNKSDQAIPTPVAIVGIPGGLEVRHDQLKELVKSGRIDAYEVIGREVVLYWRFLKANDKFDIPLSLVAAIPGSYTGPATRAYLYYTNEYKNWAPGLTVNIMPR